MEQPQERHADGDGGRDVGQEIDGLEQALKPFDGVDKQGDAQSKYQRNRQGNEQQDRCVFAGHPEGACDTGTRASYP